MRWKITAEGDVERSAALEATEALEALGFTVQRSAVGPQCLLVDLLDDLTASTFAEVVALAALRQWASQRMLGELMQQSFNEFWANRPEDIHILLTVLANNGQVFADGADPAKMLDDNLDSIPLPAESETRIRNRLRATGIVTVHMLNHLSDAALLDIPNLGQQSIDVLRDALRA